MTELRRQYESAFAEMTGALAARAFALGRQAMVVLLKALGLAAGDRVGICGFTCLSVPEAVKVAGGVPIYLDVDEALCIDPASLEVLSPGSLKVVILQHTFGVVGRLDRLLAQARRIGAAVVEDCCHSLGTCFKGRHVGSFGAGAIYSFQWGKSYSTGQGGMLTVAEAAMLEAVDSVITELGCQMSAKADFALAAQRAAYGILGGPRTQMRLRWVYHKLAALGLLKGSFAEDLGFALRAGYVRLAGPRLCRAGLRQLKQWPQLMELRVRNSAQIASLFERYDLAAWPGCEGCAAVMIRYPIRVWDKGAALAAARRSGIDLAGWYETPVHPLSGAQLLEVDYEEGCCPRAERLIQGVVHLPTGKTYSRDAAVKAIDILAWCGQQ